MGKGGAGHVAERRDVLPTVCGELCGILHAVKEGGVAHPAENKIGVGWGY